ncbi:uncharacterized protein LOC132743152 [Ruditapes philippinarum]|uniref:uncharacterized protein LOC132743152 n=1 Tax=Ruditapes philippinarum TaxID=129788 RepID=UPI00295A7B6E|nr:uncharacterized protein LOC132743152 [Ruditapes philippinarum]
MKPEIDTALNSAKFDMDFSDTLDPFDETISLLESNTATIGSVFAVLGCIFFTIGMVAFVGMMLGILCTKKPTSIMETGRTKAGSCGACLLMTSVGLAVFPLILSLLLGSTLMLLGGNFTILCAPLEDLTVLKRLVDSGLLFGGENLGEKFFNDSSLDLSVTNLFKTCRNDGTLYSGLNLGTIMNLSTLFSVDEFVPDLGDSVVMQINDTIKDISIVDVSSFNDLKSSLDLPNIDRDTAREIEDELNAIDLEGKSKEMSALADTIPDKAYADKYKTLSIALQDMHDDQKVPLLQCVNDLTTILNGMDSRSQTIKVVVTELSNDLQSLTNYVRDNAANVVLEVLNDFLDGMKTVPETLIGSVTDALSTDIGRCKTLADVYDTVIGSICTHFLDSFNVLWASFYTSGWLIIVLMISSCTLSKYFRIPCDIVYADQLQDTTYNGHPSPNSAKVDLIHYKKLADGKNTHGENADGENADGKNAHPSPNSAKVDLIHYKKLADGKNADGKNADGENADGKNADGKNAGENADGKNADGKNADGTNVDGENADGTNVDGENADGKNASNKSNNASKRNYQRLHQKWRHRRRLTTGPFTAQFFAEKMQGKSSAETIFITDSKQGINDNKPMCTVVELDDSSKDSAWCSQSLSSFEGTSGQDVINSQDIDQKLSDPHNKVDSTWVDIEESNDLNIADKSPIDCTKFDDRVKDDWQFTPEIKDFPYFQLHDDEFILLPLTRMLAESEENINEKKTIVNNNIQNNKDLVTSEEIGCTDNEEKEMSKWLNTYIIQSNSEQIASSPLVKYSSDNEMHFKQSLKVNKNHYENTVVGNTSSCQVKESNDDKNVDVEMNGSKWYVDTSKPLSQNKDRENIDETEHPVQEVVCALCKSVGIKNRKRRYSGMMEITSISSNTIEKAENDKAMKTVNIAKDDSSKTNDNFVSNFWTADQIKQLNKSFENSFQAFDDTLGNMSGEVVNDQKKRLVNSVSRPVNVMTKHTSHQKIDVNVRPYKPVKTTLSPQAAFNFWKYIEANCSCPSEIPDSLSQRKQHHSSSLHTFIDKETNVKCYAENVELLTGGYHNEQNKKLYQDGPDSLVNLAINASRLAYIPEHLNTMERQRKEQKTYTRKDGQKQELRCEVASTRKDNIKVSYL